MLKVQSIMIMALLLFVSFNAYSSEPLATVETNYHTYEVWQDTDYDTDVKITKDGKRYKFLRATNKVAQKPLSYHVTERGDIFAVYPIYDGRFYNIFKNGAWLKDVPVDSETRQEDIVTKINEEGDIFTIMLKPEGRFLQVLKNGKDHIKIPAENNVGQKAIDFHVTSKGQVFSIYPVYQERFFNVFKNGSWCLDVPKKRFDKQEDAMELLKVMLEKM